MKPNRARRVPTELVKKLLDILGGVAGVQSAVLFSSDGFEIASHAVDANASARLAAIGSSLAALGSAISAEAGLHDFNRTTIESQDGIVIIMRVDEGNTMSLVVVAGKKAVLGQLLWATQHCCQAIGKVLDK